MLLAEIDIMFYEKDTGQDSYDVDKVTKLSFKVDVDEYYIGAIENQVEISKYYFGNHYKVIATFPFMTEEKYSKYLSKWKIDNKVDICSGSKIIGEGRVLSCDCEKTS